MNEYSRGKESMHLSNPQQHIRERKKGTKQAKPSQAGFPLPSHKATTGPKHKEYKRGKGIAPARSVIRCKRCKRQVKHLSSHGIVSTKEGKQEMQTQTQTQTPRGTLRGGKEER